KKIKDEYGEAQLICSRGISYFRKSISDSAGMDYHTALEVFIRLNKKFDEANIYRQLGMLEDYNSNPTESAKMYSKAISICEKIGHERLLASCLGNLGILHERQGHSAEALRYYHRSIPLFIKNKDLHSLSSSYINVGNIFDNLRQYDSSLYYYDKGEVIAKEIGHVTLQALV